MINSRGLYPICLIFLLGLLPIVSPAQPGPRKFSQLATTDGLSQSTVNCILKDKFGFMWFGTRDGLNKYDGAAFTVYRNDPENARSLPDNQIKCMLEDSRGNLWIGTLGGGLCYYDRNLDAFLRPKDLGLQTDLPLNPAVLSLCVDRQGLLWAGTFNGLLKIDREQKKIIHFLAEPGNPAALSNATIQAIFEDAAGNFWIGTNNGLHRFDRSTGAFTRFLHDPADPNSISNDQVTTIAGDRRGHLWIGTDGGGLNTFDPLTRHFTAFIKKNGPASISGNVVRSLCIADSSHVWIGTEDALDLLHLNTGQFTHHTKDGAGQGNLSNNTVLSLLQDDAGILWAGTSEGGVNKYDPNLFYFDCYKKNSSPSSLSTDIVTSFAEDTGGDIWIGTDGGGLNRWQRGTERFIHYMPAPGHHDSLEGAAILSLLVSRKKDYLWIGSYSSGLNRLDLRTGRFTHYREGPGLHDLGNGSIYALLEDRNGDIWMGTNGGGVNVLHPADGTITRHRLTAHPDSLSNDYIRCLLEDRTGRIWIGTYSGGISIYDPATRKFSLLDKMNNNLSNQVVFSLCEDAQGNIWAGTMGGGLDRYDPLKKRFHVFNEENGLSNNIVNSIIRDDKGYLWLSTNKGISRFDPATTTFKNYGLYNGIQNPEFTVGAGFRSSDGRIFFGGINGFNVFNPAGVRDNRIAPATRFTGFSLFNRPVRAGEKNSPLKGDINQVKEITLSHDQSDFTITYAALSYTASPENRSAYMLQGFDRTWTYAGSERRATYTNLPPGRYTFLVRSGNNDGVWSRELATLVIRITPPFWLTWWAYLLYILAAVTLFYFIYKDIAAREKLKAQIRLERMTAEKTKELNNIKLNFFTHVSHELRTPLSLIMDPLRKIITQDLDPAQVRKYGSLMYNNAQRLMSLIDQMLDLRKIETGHAKLAAKPSNIVTATRNIASLFDVHAAERAISFSVTGAVDDLTVWIDPDKFEKVIFNLISNAFKYTPDNGAISVHISAEPASGYAVIHVIDTGVGIPSQLQDKVFEIFYQVEGTSRFESGSTGIGLALTRELVELHKGRVSVHSEPGRGSDFAVYLPLGDAHLDQAGQTQTTPGPDTTTAMPFIAAVPEPQTSVQPIDGTLLPLLLLVEDNKDLREYLRTELSASYQVEDASDGLQGFTKALEIVPDLIVSDIMMPGLTGLELCTRIKTDERTSHIPVILLTARQADAHQVEGYSAGADAYIPKPFNMEVVFARINNLLESRRKLRERWTSLTSPQPMSPSSPTPPEAPAPIAVSPAQDNADAASAMHPLDTEFLAKATRIIEEHLSDITFDTDILADKLRVSRRQLYRKLKALTNRTVHDFVTGIRLNRAASLLLTGEYTIAEVAYKVGYSEPANFSRSFARQFGMSPRKYLSDLENKGSA